MNQFDGTRFETYEWSHYQQGVFDALPLHKKIVVKATAGSGKSTVIEAIIYLVDMSPNGAAFIQFNRSIRDEMKQRVPQIYKDCVYTLNQLMYSNLRKLAPHYQWDIDARKYWKMIYQWACVNTENKNEAITLTSQIEDALKKVMVTLTNPNDDHAIADALDEYDAFGSMMDIWHFNVIRAALALGEMAASEDYRRLYQHGLTGDTGAIANEMISKGKTGWGQDKYGFSCKKRTIDFDEQIYLPIVWDLITPEFNWVLADEAQDFSRMHIEAISRMLLPDAHCVFVGDPRQSIYRFNGADSLAISRIIDRFDAFVAPLSITYRCPKSHVRIAQQFAPEIEAAPWANEGEVYEDLDYSTDYINHCREWHKNGDEVLIMCRRNAPLIAACYKMLAAKIPANLRGRDFGKQIYDVVEKICLSSDRKSEKRGFNFDEMDIHLKKWFDSEYMKLERRDAKESAFVTLRDKLDSMEIMWANSEADNAFGFLDEIFNLFEDESYKKGMINLATVHKSKGLEAGNTAILEWDKMPMTWRNQSEAAYDQECNIAFVATTRSKNRMYMFNSAGDE